MSKIRKQINRKLKKMRKKSEKKCKKDNKNKVRNKNKNRKINTNTNIKSNNKSNTNLNSLTYLSKTQNCPTYKQESNDVQMYIHNFENFATNKEMLNSIHPKDRNYSIIIGISKENNKKCQYININDSCFFTIKQYAQVLGILSITLYNRIKKFPLNIALSLSDMSINNLNELVSTAQFYYPEIKNKVDLTIKDKKSIHQNVLSYLRVIHSVENQNSIDDVLKDNEKIRYNFH